MIWQNFKDFIILNDKKPIHKLSNPKSWDEVEDKQEVAVLIQEPFIVLDVDDEVSSLKLSQFLKSQDLEVFQVRTKRGIHFWFKSKVLPNYIKKITPIGVEVDIRSHGKLSYVVIKQDNVWRDILTPHLSPYNTIELPNWLIPSNDKLLNEANSVIDLDEGDGRRDALFQRIIPLANIGFKKEEVKWIINSINEHFFKKPINNNELETLYTDETIWTRYEEKAIHNEIKAYFTVNEKGNKVWCHDLFAMYIHELYSGYKKDDLYWLYYQDRYQTGKLLLDQLMITELTSIKQHQRAEVRSFLMAYPDTLNHSPSTEHSLILTQNGILDVETHEQLEYSSDYFVDTKINVKVNPEIETDEVDAFLLSVANNNTDIRDLLEEIMGYILLPDQRYQTAFIALGGGSNGKSTWLRMIQEMIGFENISAIDYTQITDKFKMATLLGKILNIGEEMPNKLTKSPEVFKKLITGEAVQVEFKNENTFVLRNKAKFIFTANELPPTSDRSYGFYRKWIIIPFTNVFDKTTRDNNLAKKFKQETFKSAVLNVALRGLKRLLLNDKFTECQEVKDTMTNYQIENNTTLRFLREEIINHTNILDCSVSDTFRRYKDFCQLEGFLHLSNPKFIKETLKEFSNIEIRVAKIGGIDIKVFKKKEGH